MRVRLALIIGVALVQCAAALLLMATLSPTAFAQTPARRTSASSTTSPSTPAQTRDSQTQTSRADAQSRQADPQADLSITAHVTADSLRFEKVPNPRVEFTGRPRRETVWEADRDNLPPRVEPGVTYRNIGITLRITSVFADIDRIVAEALGEVPINDDASSTPTQPNPMQPTPTQLTSTHLAAQTHATAVTTQRRRPTHKGRGN
jgi:hypothetical protein